MNRTPMCTMSFGSKTANAPGSTSVRRCRTLSGSYSAITSESGHTRRLWVLPLFEIRAIHPLNKNNIINDLHISRISPMGALYDVATRARPSNLTFLAQRGYWSDGLAKSHYHRSGDMPR